MKNFRTGGTAKKRLVTKRFSFKIPIGLSAKNSSLKTPLLKIRWGY